MEIRKGRHVVYLLHAHLVFVTKRRGKVFDAARIKRLEEIFRSVCTDFEAVLKEFNGEPRPRTLAGQLSAEGAPVRVDEQPQRRLVAAHEAGIPGYLDVLECPQEQGSPVVAKLFCGVRGRRADYDSPPIHRGPEPAFGRCTLNPGPKGPGTSCFLIAAGRISAANPPFEPVAAGYAFRATCPTSRCRRTEKIAV